MRRTEGVGDNVQYCCRLEDTILSRQCGWSDAFDENLLIKVWTRHEIGEHQDRCGGNQDNKYAPRPYHQSLLLSNEAPKEKEERKLHTNDRSPEQHRSGILQLLILDQLLHKICRRSAQASLYIFLQVYIGYVEVQDDCASYESGDGEEEEAIIDGDAVGIVEAGNGSAHRYYDCDA